MKPHSTIDAMWLKESDLVYEADPGLAAVADWFRAQDDFEARFGQAVRRSLNEVLDGARTGRYDTNDLEKTEKTYVGTKVEIVVRATFELTKSRPMDYLIAGRQVDAKFSFFEWGWSVPVEAMDHLCLVLYANDHASLFRVGLIRINSEVLTNSGNRDGKRGISARGRRKIHWLVADGALPENLLLQLTPEERSPILAPDSGQKRVNELFRRVQGVLINRDSVEPVAQQTDIAKRVRDSRLQLAHEGIVVLGHQAAHPGIARALGIPVPKKGEWISVRLVPDLGDGRPSAVIKEQPLVLAHPDEPAQPLRPGY
ncbi:NaeI family type II restriction endonuclease [Glycomyces sp. NPDC049804]|uniref:NaeI family type II restriction endonuclease n=1 Tax=Glycomyces sp. NPDC049804 TaxID=3154363 RepID=UPI003434E3DE